MTKPTQARAEARALLNAVLVGAAIGTTTAAALTSVYLVGGMAQDAVTHARIANLADAAATGFSHDTLLEMSSADPSALAVALRQDPNLLTGYAPRDRSEAFAARLDAKSAKQPHLLRASLSPANPAARPYQMSALDQSRQLDCLSQAVYYEARGETPAGQAAVAQVVLNRVRHSAYPNSICSVVYQGAQAGRGCQFSFACDGSMRRAREPGAWRRATKVAERALGGYVMAAVGNSTHFHVTSVSPGWGARLQRVGQIGTHVFYRFGGRAGGPGAFTATPTAEKPQITLASMTVVPDETPSATSTVADAAAAVVDAVMLVDKPATSQAATPKAEAPKAKPEPVKVEATTRAREPMAAADTATPAV